MRLLVKRTLIARLQKCYITSPFTILLTQKKESGEKAVGTERGKKSKETLRTDA